MNFEPMSLRSDRLVRKAPRDGSIVTLTKENMSLKKQLRKLKKQLADTKEMADCYMQSRYSYYSTLVLHNATTLNNYADLESKLIYLWNSESKYFLDNGKHYVAFLVDEMGYLGTKLIIQTDVQPHHQGWFSFDNNNATRCMIEHDGEDSLGRLYYLEEPHEFKVVDGKVEWVDHVGVKSKINNHEEKIKHLLDDDLEFIKVHLY